MRPIALLHARRALAAIAALGLAAAAFQIVCRCTLPLGNSDVFWQVRAGALALAEGRVPDADVFSYTIPGEPWNNHEWLFELLAALLQRAFGWGALRLLVLATWGGAAIAIAVTVGRRAGVAAALLAVELFHLWAGYKLKPVPQTLSIPIFLAALCFFRGPVMLRSRGRAAALVGFLLVWGNLTAEALTFLPFLILDQLCLRRARRAPEAPPDPADPKAPPSDDESGPDRTTLLLLVLACLAPLLNPPWASTLDYALRGTAVNRVVNTEFTPLWAAAAAVQPLAKHVARLVVLVYVVFAARALRAPENRWETLRRVGPGLLACGAAVLLERDLWLLVVPVATMLVALSRTLTDDRRLALGAGALVAAIGLHLGYASQIGWSAADAWPVVRDRGYRTEHVDPELVPVACVEQLADAPAGTRLFTLRMWASWAIFRLPQVRVFSDGRNLEYPLELHDAAARVWAGAPGAAAILDATKTERVIARPGWHELPGLRGSGWHPIAAGPRCAVFGR